jgi:2-polyprenyl-3-methyl-5-hydroxy-6-metoxy-1,4-benzoquinol methylase
VPLGSSVRLWLGPLETPASELYRQAFFNVNHFAELTLILAPCATRVLEIGCGDGAVADRITAIYPSAEYVGVDVAPEPGRRFIGDRSRATFQTMRSSDLRAAHPEPFDLVLVVDVLHHIPDDPDRIGLISDAAAMLADGGTLLIKEWERIPTLSYAAGYAADRYISGDRHVRFMQRAALLKHIRAAAPKLRHAHTITVRPWRCNVVHVLRAM